MQPFFTSKISSKSEIQIGKYEVCRNFLANFLLWMIGTFGYMTKSFFKNLTSNPQLMFFFFLQFSHVAPKATTSHKRI
jgi:hypothetical protein